MLLITALRSRPSLEVTRVPSRQVLADFALYTGSFALADHETLASALDELDAARIEYLANVRATDPSGDTTAPPAPWGGLDEPTPSVRRYEFIRGGRGE